MYPVFTNPALKKIRKILRHNMPRPEVRLWIELKGKKLKGYKFRRQHSIDRYVVDFYCPELMLAIELDGNSHCGEMMELYDSRRQELIESYGVKFLRFKNSDVNQNIGGVIEEIIRHLPDK